MTDGATTNIRFCHLTHLNGTLDTRVNVLIFESILQGECVHHRRHHPHIVCRRAIHPLRTACKSAPDIPSADHNGDIDAVIAHLLNLCGDCLDNLWIDPESLISRERFSAQLQHDATIFRFQDNSSCHAHSLRHYSTFLQKNPQTICKKELPLGSSPLFKSSYFI